MFGSLEGQLQEISKESTRLFCFDLCACGFALAFVSSSSINSLDICIERACSSGLFRAHMFDQYEHSIGLYIQSDQTSGVRLNICEPD